MGARFWTRRYLQVLAGSFVVIAAAHLARGRGLSQSTAQAAAWAVIAATVFTASRYVQSRRGQRCVICRDTPEDGAD